MENITYNVVTGNVTIGSATPEEIARLTPRDPATVQYEQIDGALLGEVVRVLCDSDRRITAIKLVRKVRNYGLRMAKGWVDNNFPRSPSTMPPWNPPRKWDETTVKNEPEALPGWNNHPLD